MIVTLALKEPGGPAQSCSLAAFAEMYSQQQQNQGYAPASIKASMRLVADFVTWLEERQIDASGVAVSHAGKYLDHRWLHRQCRRGDAFTLEGFARLCADVGQDHVPAPPAAILPAQRVRLAFERHLVDERGLAAASVRLYGDAVGRYLSAHPQLMRLAVDRMERRWEGRP